MKSFLLVSLALVLSATTNAFMSNKSPTSFVRQDTSLNIFGGGGNAAGGTVLSYNGKKKSFKPGSPMSSAVKALGVPVKYSCKKGDCATCQITVAGRYTKPCVAKVPPPPTLKSLQEKGLEIRV